MSYHQRRKTMDKIPTEGQALAMMMLIMLGGTLALNIFVNLFIFS